MNSDTAELAVTEEREPPPVALATRPAPATREQSWAARGRDALLGDPERAAALRDTWRALWSSRLLAWGAGLATVLALGFGPTRGAFDPPGVTRGLGRVGNVLAAPVARWDSAWYLVIAHYGYRPNLGSFTVSRAAFFPLYPEGIRSLAWLGLPPILAGVLLSVLALALALYGIHRLTTLELGRLGGALAGNSADVARLAVLLTAFAPMAFYLSAVYSESLYLALSVGLFLSARRGHWLQVGLLGGLASATRSTGLVLILPALMIYLYGPREDRPPDRERRDGTGRWVPRYRLRRDALWLCLLPLGVVAFAALIALGGGEALAPFHAQQVWGRHVAGPYVGVWDGLVAAFDGARQLLSFQSAHVYFPAAHGSPSIAATHNLMMAGFLVAGLAALVATFRRLPLAYGAYVLAALALPLSYPVSAEPLMSLPRFLLVLFPLTIASASWLAERPRARRPMLVLSGVLMVGFVAQFATWHWVA
jgi:hypothetical protein